MLSFNSKFHLSLTEVSVQRAPVSLACWVGIPVYLVLIVSFICHRLKYQSREFLSPLLAGLESQLPQVHITLSSFSSFNSNCHLSLTEVSVQGAPVSLACWVGIPVSLVLIVTSIYNSLKSQSRELLSPLLAGFESHFI